MNFNHTDERRMLADSLNRFIADQYAFDLREKAAASARGYSSKIWSELANIGAMGALFTEAEGGLGGEGFDIAVVFEALGRGLVVEPLLGALMAGQAIAKSGDVRAPALLTDIVDGSKVVAFAHEEVEPSPVQIHVQTRAECNSDGWLLNGAKSMVPQGEQCDVFIVSARTSGEVNDNAGVSLFRIPAITPGLTVRGCQTIDGGRLAEIFLDDVQLQQDSLLGVEGHAQGAIESALDAGVLALCAESLGAMEVAQTTTLEYLKTRKQFGSLLGRFQALQHRMVDLYLEIEQTRSAVIRAAAALEGNDRVQRARAISAAKFTVGRVGTLVAEEAIQLHGGIGMTWELPLSHYAKRLIMIDHQLGDEHFHLSRYMAFGKALSS